MITKEKRLLRTRRVLEERKTLRHVIVQFYNATENKRKQQSSFIESIFEQLRSFNTESCFRQSSKKFLQNCFATPPKKYLWSGTAMVLSKCFENPMCIRDDSGG